MNDLVKGSGGLLTQRTPELIAAEINNIKRETRTMLLYNSIEIGRRLVEAKELVEHGQWGEWLEKSVDYSQRTANNLMRIFEEYAADQITMLTDNAKSQAIANLSYTQAVALLGVPEDEREQFIEENDIENMTTRELQQAIKDRDKAVMEKEQLENQLDKALDEKSKIENKVKTLISEKDKLVKELDSAAAKKTEDISKANKELEKVKKDLEKYKTQIKELESKPIEVHKGATEEDIEKVKAEATAQYEKELALLKVDKEQAEKRIRELELKNSQQNNAAALKYSVYFDELVKTFKELLSALAEIKETDEEAYGRYKNAISGLIAKMVERI